MYGHPVGIKYLGCLGIVKRVNYTTLFLNSWRN